MNKWGANGRGVDKNGKDPDCSKPERRDRFIEFI